LGSDSDEERGPGGSKPPAALQPEKAKKRLKKMMRDTGLEDSSDDEGSSDGKWMGWAGWLAGWSVGAWMVRKGCQEDLET